MPELPEVETIRRTLLPLPSTRIANVTLSAVAPLEHCSRQTVRRALLNAQCTALTRHGKYLLLWTDRDAGLVLHLGMTGRLLRVAAPSPPAPHTHCELHFADRQIVRYTDPRRFGTISLTHDPRGADNPFLQRLGPDYLDPALRPEHFIVRVRRHPRLALKALLLHQGIAAGMGNIYACEALYHAALDPCRTVARCSDAELARLLHAARHVLAKGITHGGTTLRDYVDGHGSRGAMQTFLQVYGRDGLSTLDGRGMVSRFPQHGRSTWFAPEIQR
ncbi:MAG: bifunctional DNA-formamidopyrimidine glycosylase/DNA-(apurinic or apyrimidinic site) lyase [Deltaproteobacteria bacterium]|nr:bifunctional DNA-formamidopyrimidine glycosylase/DNA-(apurinic or apyrimidinic site) lyase [Deltaproteobacteria bacterium]